ncbi:MAG: branched-chain amino acid ABC transporter permease [Lachnospiraceae bacterium]|nr:branched-chain amino acid ABC transporter permease [Lachnospiraceae bacterium]
MSWYYIEGILIQSCYTLLIVLGLSILTGYTGMFSFGHAGFVCIGAYVSVLCTMGFGLPYWLALLIAGLTAMVFGAGLGKITLGLKGDYFCIATLGVGEAIRLIFNNLNLNLNIGGKSFILDGAKGIASIPLHTTFPIALVIVVFFLTATALLMKSKHGRNMLAVREDELAAQMCGINTFRSKMLAMCMSALYAGIAGGMLAHYFGYLQPKMFLMTKSTEYTIMVIFGGMGSITGSVLGTVLLCALPELLRAVGDWRLVFYGLAVIVIMIVRPKGLMGGKEITDLKWFKAIVRLFKGKKKEQQPPPDEGEKPGEEAQA